MTKIKKYLFQSLILITIVILVYVVLLYLILYLFGFLKKSNGTINLNDIFDLSHLVVYFTEIFLSILLLTLFFFIKMTIRFKKGILLTICFFAAILLWFIFFEIINLCTE